jgi:hypothetical protein
VGSDRAPPLAMDRRRGMSPLARTVFIFGIYVIGVGLAMMLVPGVIFQVLGIPTTDEPWIHLVGYLAVVIGFYYVVAARSGVEAFFRATVPLRLVSAVVFVGVAALWGYWPIAFFAVPDVAGALWTWSVMRRPAAVTTG